VTIDDLYGVPLEDFVPARDDLARELAAAGEHDEAKRVKSLRKPTITAWTLNHLARERSDLIAALVEAHAALRSADSAGAMRAASEARMGAIQLIIAAPEEATEAVRKKMRSTLLATATDSAAEEALLAGRLQSELEPGGLGGFEMASEFATATPAAASASKSKARDQKKGEKAESAKTVKARERVERMEQEADEAAAEARTLRAEADRAERLAASAEERAAKKQIAADTAREKLDTG
jgi:hypothetical protein